MSETIATICSTATELPEVFSPAWVLQESMRRGCVREVILEAAGHCEPMAPEVAAWLEAAAQKLGEPDAFKVSDAIDALPPGPEVAALMIESALDGALIGRPEFVRSPRGWLPLSRAGEVDIEHSAAWLEARAALALAEARALERLAERADAEPSA